VYVMQLGEGIFPHLGLMWREIMVDSSEVLRDAALVDALGIEGVLPLASGDLRVTAWPVEDVGMMRYQAVWRVLARTPRGWCVHMGYGGSVRAAVRLGMLHFGVQAERLRVWLRQLPDGAPRAWEDGGEVWTLDVADWVPRGCVCFDVDAQAEEVPDEQAQNEGAGAAVAV